MICHMVSGSEAYQPSLMLSSRSSRKTNSTDGVGIWTAFLKGALVGWFPRNPYLLGTVQERDNSPTKLFMDRLRTRGCFLLSVAWSAGHLKAAGFLMYGTRYPP